MNVRTGKPTDKKEYLKTQMEAFPNIDSNRDSKFFEEKVKNNEIFVLEEKGNYVGHICFGTHKFNPPFAESVFIEEFAVKQKFRGNGFGTCLMEKLVAYCKKNKIQAIHLGTGDTDDNKTIKYYEKQGFKKVGWLEDIDPHSEYTHPQFFYAILVKDWTKQ
jgi:ribosomal protein S18 acetylase RimI-like enzyme